VVARLDQEVEAGDALDLEGDRLLTRLEAGGCSVAEPADSDRLLRHLLPRLTGKRAGEPVSWEGSAIRVPETASGSNLLGRDQVGCH
jgi:hypothetical protein